MKKRVLSLLLALCLSTVCLISLSGCNRGAFTVNGLAVETDELLYVMHDMEAVVMFELEEEFGVNAEAVDFWEAPQNGKNMLYELQKRAQAVIVLEKVEQLVAQDNGISTQLTYSGQLRELESINAQRSQAAAAGEIIYGPVIRNFVAYKSGMMSDLRRDLRALLQGNGTLVVTDAQVNAEFEKRKEDLLENTTEEEAKARLLEDLYDDAYDAYMAEAAAKAEISVNVKVDYEMYVNFIE